MQRSKKCLIRSLAHLCAPPRVRTARIDDRSGCRSPALAISMKRLAIPSARSSARPRAVRVISSPEPAWFRDRSARRSKMSVRLIVARQTHVAAAQMTDAENDKVTAGAVAPGQIYQRVGFSGQRCHRPDKNGYCNSDGNQYAQDHLLHDCSPVWFCSPARHAKWNRISLFCNSVGLHFVTNFSRRCGKDTQCHRPRAASGDLRPNGSSILIGSMRPLRFGGSLPLHL